MYYFIFLGHVLTFLVKIQLANYVLPSNATASLVADIAEASAFWTAHV